MGRGDTEAQAPVSAPRRRVERPKPKPGECRPVLMSLQPQWSEKIFSGEKTIELRRNRAGCEPGTPIAIYTSFPRKKLDGRCRVQEVINLPLSELWKQTKSECGCTKDEFDSYFEGCDSGWGIRLTNVERFEDPKDLGFNGPQSYRYLFADDPQQKQVLQKAGLLD